MRRLLLATSGALLGFAAGVGIALATPSTGVSSTTIGTGDLEPVNLNVLTGDGIARLRTKGETSVTVVENRVAPGGSFGWHSHPGPSLIIVKSGTITFYRGDDPTCAPEVYEAGEALVDPGNDVHIGRNEGAEEVVVIVTRFLPTGAAPRIDEPDPGTCGF
jgi:quercetin dioxygenase-like cupin family protein